MTRANDRLSRLHAAGLLHRHLLGTVAGGRKALYSLSQRGAGSVGESKVWRLQRADDELLVGEAFVEHQLAVNSCWISVKCGPEANLVRFVRFNEPIARSIPLAPDGYCEFSIGPTIQPVFLEVDLGTETSRGLGQESRSVSQARHVREVRAGRFISSASRSLLSAPLSVVCTAFAER